MRLLFDENLSRHLATRLADVFPGADHVIPLGLERTKDSAIWEHAKAKGFAIVTQDSDFAEKSAAEGAPPKIIWIHIGNSVTANIEKLLRTNQLTIQQFLEDPTAACLNLERESGAPFVAV